MEIHLKLSTPHYPANPIYLSTILIFLCKLLTKSLCGILETKNWSSAKHSCLANRGFYRYFIQTHLLFHRVNIRFNISNEALRSEHATKPSGVGLMLNNLKYIPDKYKTPPLLTMMATEPRHKRDQKTHFSTNTKLNWSNFNISTF